MRQSGNAHQREIADTPDKAHKNGSTMNSTSAALHVFSSDISVYTYTLHDDSGISIDDALSCVNDAERQRADRFHYARDRDYYLRGRGYLRRLLSWHLKTPPQRVPIVGAPGQKPALDNNPLYFNLSHSGHLAVCAISRSRPVGIDIELVDHAVPHDALCRKVFTPRECDALGACEETEAPRRFFEYWTAKEALMKLTGLGIRLNPRSIELALDGGRPSGYCRPRLPRAHLLRLSLPGTEGLCICHLATPRS
ncbi:4'-phosphopantetheinyl transferase family protein [Microbulbifer hainanensis]|uniref:4'-phosphopantetheinyl transferase family protein n=1 Tax=Microbulbifer hainanensis TaxID=2735675 RepID=UPI00186958C8|nr:4'-phosphopantetheinyl transferase superfamily protein [Microbulbifer hainanensis]